MSNKITINTSSLVVLGVSCLVSGIALGMFISDKIKKDDAEDYIETDICDEEGNDEDDENDEKDEDDEYLEKVDKYVTDSPDIIKEKPEDSLTIEINKYIRVITPEAFMNCEEETFTQSTLVWLNDDGTMIDSRDYILPESEWRGMLGCNIRDYFGALADDKDVVYIRNDRTRMEYEIVREYSSYAKNVLGIEDEYESDDKEYEKALEYFDLNNKDGKD